MTVDEWWKLEPKDDALADEMWGHDDEDENEDDDKEEEE